jgi:hypothetical protein
MDAKLESELNPYERQMLLLDGIPGINRVTAATVIAEIGIKMSQWPPVFTPLHQEPCFSQQGDVKRKILP